MGKFAKYSLIACAFLLNGPSSFAQLKRPFTPRHSEITNGAMTFVANSIIKSSRIVPQGCGYNPPANNPLTSEAPPGTATGDQIKNDMYVGSHIDIDNDPTTLNSSSADLNLPGCNTVAFAGLYWGAGIAISQGSGCAATGNTPMSAVNNWNKVKFKVPGASNYVTLTASQMDTVTTTFHGYQGYVDVTSLVQAAGPGTYTVADVKCDTGKVNTYGGWTMVVIYDDPAQPSRSFTIFDGFAIVNSGSGNLVDFTVKGFKAPPSGNVGARIGTICYDGDRGALDGFSIRDTTGTLVDQTTAPQGAATTSNTKDAWNSSITDNGNNVTTRNPAFGNTMGYDADIFALYNLNKRYIRNNDSVLSMRINSSNEGFVLGMVAVRVDNFTPVVRLEDSVTDLNGGALVQGDTLLIKSFFKNRGTDTALNVVFLDSLAPAFKFVSGSIRVNDQPRTDAAGDDVASYDAATKTIRVNMGVGANATAGGALYNVPAADTNRISYRVTISTDCAETGDISNVFYHSSLVAYKGKSNQKQDTSRSRNRPAAGGCLQPEAPRAFNGFAGCEALPIRLSTFTGRADGTAAVLDWSAYEDLDAAYYELHYAEDGRSFRTIHTEPAVAALGLASYRYAHRPAGPVAYYRLVAVEKNGAQSYSQVVRINFGKAEDAHAPLLYPNPATAGITLEHAPGTDPVQVRIGIYNAMGQQVRSLAANAGVQHIGLEGLPAGLYFLSYQSAEGSYRLSFVKQ